jgi:hypothetical protein
MHGLSTLLLGGRLQAMYGGRTVEELAAVVGANLHRGLAPDARR